MSTGRHLPKPIRIPHARTKTGCLPCRRRRKKCDESRPICAGCDRNQLICHWPRTSSPESNYSPQSSHGSGPYQIATQDITASGHLSTLTPFPAPAIFRDEQGSRLLSYYVSVTARRMTGRADIENPFLTYNLRIAESSEILQHTILAISSAHIAYGDPSVSDISRSHYAVALRSLKHSITKWSLCSVDERVALLATSLALCWYEVIDANTEGSLYHHLRGSKSMLHDLCEDGRLRDPCTLGFFAEQYSYLAISANIGLGAWSGDRDVDRHYLCDSLKTLNHGSPIRGFMFGYAHQLFETIPRIRDLADQQKQENVNKAMSQARRAEIVSTIVDWQPDEDCTAPEYEFVGRMYQQACLIFLYTALHGYKDATESLFSNVEPCIQSFLSNFDSLSYEAAPWTIFMWATLVAGSCIRDISQRQQLSQILSGSTINMRAVEGVANCLELHWQGMDEDPSIYGPYGLERTMIYHGLNMCVG